MGYFCYKNKIMKKMFLLLVIMSLVSIGFSQEAAEVEDMKDLTNGTVQEQFDYITTKSGNYQEYKVVKKESLKKLKINVLDTLNQKNKSLETYRLEIENRNKQISDSREQMIALDEQMQATNNQKDSINFFGSSMKKAAYKSIMWSIVGVLSLVLLFFAFRAFQNGVAKNEAKSALQTIQEEYDLHMKRSLEREQKLNRALQDEKNKHI